MGEGLCVGYGMGFGLGCVRLGWIGLGEVGLLDLTCVGLAWVALGLLGPNLVG